ncbi:MAG: MgtC/SapB family protein [Methanomicrobia archaeon]|nr:MgtC/SapB family protein [Methanomicrobia archaeon]HDM22885.1 MgtC/SapB family protein [Methanomicrobia archaeon]
MITTIALIFRILLSVILGAIVGFEREIEEKPAGIRTHILVCMGATLFTISSFYLTPLSSGDATRIAAGIVTGIGFIGAGSIIATKGHVKGLTTAASLWVVSGIGMMVGLGSYILSSASAIIVFIVLRLGEIKKKILK